MVRRETGNWKLETCKIGNLKLETGKDKSMAIVKAKGKMGIEIRQKTNLDRILNRNDKLRHGGE